MKTIASINQNFFVYIYTINRKQRFEKKFVFEFEIISLLN